MLHYFKNEFVIGEHRLTYAMSQEGGYFFVLLDDVLTLSDYFTADIADNTIMFEGDKFISIGEFRRQLLIAVEIDRRLQRFLVEMTIEALKNHAERWMEENNSGFKSEIPTAYQYAKENFNVQQQRAMREVDNWIRQKELSSGHTRTHTFIISIRSSKA